MRNSRTLAFLEIGMIVVVDACTVVYGAFVVVAAVRKEFARQMG